MNKVSVIQGQLSQSRANFALLRSGSVVTGRVLAKNADGSYSVSLAGQKINVRSETALKTGALFSAKVSLKGNVVSLSLIKENPSSEMLQKFGASSQLSPQVANLLTSLGFEPDADSFKILQFMQQLGMKIDVEAAKKALRQTEKSENKEEKSQLFLLLEEKGIKAGDKTIEKIIGRGEGGSSQQEKKKNQHKDESRTLISKERLEPKKEDYADYALEGIDGDEIIKNHSVFIEMTKSYFSSLYSACKDRKIGPLTAFNTVLSASGKNPPLRHWLILPFEWTFGSYYGNIRLLFDSALSNLEKAVINLKNPTKSHVFLLDYNKGKLDSVEFASTSFLSASKKSFLSDLLSSMFGGQIRLEAKDFNSLAGFCSGDEKFSFLDGSA